MNTETISKTAAVQIAGTILKQIFSQDSRLKFVIKQKSFDSDGTLQLRFTNPKGANHVSISLNEMDTYDMQFHECRILKKDPYIINEIKELVSGIYWDSLADVIKSNVEVLD